MAIEILRKKFTVEQYHQMAKSGILTLGDRVELLGGEVIQMPPVGRAHWVGVDCLTELLSLALAFKAIVRVRSPIALGSTSAPQPDIAVLRERIDFYGEEPSRPGDIFALVEVSDRTVEFERLVKLPIYAASGIAEVWIVDLVAGAVEVYREPGAGGYGQVQVLRGRDGVRFMAFPDVEFRVDEFFGGEG
ncbi:MAG: Uma2 family endonuclease [Nodosilinea sp. LVE1205-7]|jgi:Uma2 family endonuclease